MKRKRKILKENYDVAVIGGGLSGVCCAIASARQGAKTVLIQDRPVFGGNSSSEVRMHICGANCHAKKKDLEETGILLELLLNNKKSNKHFSFSMWDMSLWGKLKTEKNLTFYTNCVMNDVNMCRNKIKKVICHQSTTEYIYEISAKIFVDATGNASLGYYAGAEYRMGSEDRYEFNEKDAPDKVNDYVMGDTLLFMSKDVKEKAEFVKPCWAYSFTEEDLYKRPHGNTFVDRGKNGVIEEYTASSGYWWVELGGDSGNIIEKSENIREELFKSVFGIWDHIKNFSDHGAENLALDWVGQVAGTRESRRLVGDYLVNENDVLSNRVFDDAVAYGGWPMDRHTPKGLFDKGIEPTHYINFDGCYTIPYRSYYSKNIDNLMMAGRDISTSKMAFSSARVMGTCAVGGQAVGTAAGMAIKYRCSPREIGKEHIEELQQQLLKDDCYIPKKKNNDTNDIAKKAEIYSSSFIENYEPINVVSGIARPEDGKSNAWESNGINENGEVIGLKYNEEQTASQIRITFDCDLNSEIMVSMTPKVQLREPKDMPLPLVKDYSVKIYKSDSVVYEKDVYNNIQRLNVLNLDKKIVFDKIEITVKNTYGYQNARIFEIRVY